MNVIDNRLEVPTRRENNILRIVGAKLCMNDDKESLIKFNIGSLLSM
jgi:hypothetical protein